MKGQGGGGTAKGGGKNRSGGGSVAVTKTKARATKAVEGNIMKLRQALFNDDGKDKNVLEGIAKSFLSYERNGLAVDITFSPELTDNEVTWAFDLTKDHMEKKYNASGYGWDEDDKFKELTEQGARFLIMRSRETNELVGFAHFRFTVQGEVVDQMVGEPVLYVMDIQLASTAQRKGLGKHILVLLELIARRQQMTRVSIPVYLGDADTKAWLDKQKGYQNDESYALIGVEPEAEGFELYSKIFAPVAAKPAPAVVAPKPAAVEVTKAADGKLPEVPTTVFQGLTISEENKDAQPAIPKPDEPIPGTAEEEDGWVRVDTA